ncbi:MAG: Rieske 2Fe-2S domain-containing protein [Alphaproteobacteria bacterium]|nr:Rieske 2Fe-2S domain-containing protein [Alphaproteobacteria bacterium]
MSSARPRTISRPLSELKNLGDYITGYAGGVPVVVMRNEAGLVGFVNVCRHRRHEVMKGRGNARVMRCAITLGPMI